MNQPFPNPLLSFTPDPAEFAIEWLDRREAAGCLLRPFRLTTARFPDGEVRTYGLVGVPPGSGSFPAILELWYSYGDAAHGDRCWCRTNRWETGTDGSLVLDLPAAGQTWLFLRQADPLRQTTQCSLPVCVDASLPGTRPRQTRLLYAPGSVDGLGSTGSTELYGTNELEDSLDLTADGLTATAPGAAVPQIIVRTPLRYGASAATARTRLELELTGVMSLQIDCLCGTTIQPDNYCRRLESPDDGRVTLAAGEFVSASASAKALPDFRGVKALVLSGQSRPGERLCVRRIRWANGNR